VFGCHGGLGGLGWSSVALLFGFGRRAHGAGGMGEDASVEVILNIWKWPR